jgi:predicted RNA-binding Zn-ribbon protein involved in translation (DUF1610 family)/succinate dehydrogenase flavin-adding protein (antitoxin of CptAB toxin-antitoxin module)
MVDSKKVANNILDFLIDPTRVPVMERVYFGPGENLKNEVYEKAKADACVAFKDQKHNSDFYPQKNRLLNREANKVMDRKALIASFDVLSKNFKNASDPFAVDLQTMAKALSGMKDEELSHRLASDAPDLETVLAAKTFKCPDCGTNVLQQTGYCVKCKKKVKQASEEEVDKEAMLTPMPKSIGERPERGPETGGPAIRNMEEFARLWDKKDPKLTAYIKKLLGLKDACDDKEAMLTPMPKSIGERPERGPETGGPAIRTMDEFAELWKKKDPKLLKWLENSLGIKKASDIDFWTKEASDIVARTLVTEIIGVTAKEEKAVEPKKECPVVKEEVMEVEAKKECPVEKSEPEEKSEEVVQAKAEEKVAPVVEEETPAEKPKEAVEETPSVVDTDVLASYNFAGIEVPMNSMDEVGELSTQEKANLAQLF